MKRIMTFCAALLLVCVSTSKAQFDSLWRGAFLFGAHNVNTDQMEDSLHLNAFQTSTGYSSSEDSLFFSSIQDMRVINQRKKLGDWATDPNDPGRASGQQMVYQAEQLRPLAGGPVLKNYFDQRPVGRTEGDARVAEAGVDTLPGYMVKSAVPNNEYHYNRTNYLATFRLKVDAPYEPEDTVVNCIVTCAGNGGERAHLILLGDSFDSAGAWREFTIPFTISFPLSATDIPSGSHFLTGGTMSSEASAGQAVAPCGGIDLQVYWYGYVTTYLDKVTVQDSVALRLFAGVYDQEIAQEANLCATKRQHERFHLVDEPYISAFQAFEYVGRKINEAVGSTLGVRAGSVTPQYHDFERFLIDSNTPELLIDPYFVSSDIPHPSIGNNEANRSGSTP
jgi:hypothetical protein